MKRILKLTWLSLTVVASFIAAASPAIIRAEKEVPQVLYMRLTAYSSSEDETDYNPFYTANGKHVADGFVASNKFPFGTKIQIPELFGDKIFTIEDRMAKRFQKTVDIWMPSKKAALYFGVTHANVFVYLPGTQISEK